VHGLQELPRVILTFVDLGFSAFGGVTSTLPELEHIAVSSNHWMTSQQFVDIYALGQATPGPGSMMVIGVGYFAAGWPGGIAALLAMLIPLAILTYVVGAEWDRLRNWRWRPPIEHGIIPVTVGLLLAGSFTLVHNTATDWLGALVVAAAAGLFLSRRVNPVVIIILGGVAGLLTSRL
jgi:chromate transporter